MRLRISPPDLPTPGSTWYTTNFIKRLVGRPNESVMIVDGDVYVRDAAAVPGVDDRFAGFRIQGKPRHVQDALWRVVVDGEFVPLSGTNSCQKRSIRSWRRRGRGG